MNAKVIRMFWAALLLCTICACGNTDAPSTHGSMDRNSNGMVPSEQATEDKSENLTEFERLFANGPVPAQDGNALWGYIDISGEYVIEPRFLSVRPLKTGGLTLVQDAENQLWGYIDNSGNYAIKPIFSEANDFGENNIASVREAESGLCGLIDISGAYITEPRFIRIGEAFHDGLLPAEDPSSRLFGYIDETGAYQIEPQFNLADDFKDGRAKISSQRRLISEGYYYDLLGYIDTSGKKVIPDIFEEIYPFSEGLAVVKQYELYGYINESGEYVIEPLYESATSFSNGVAFVSAGLSAIDNRYCWPIDKNGNAISDLVCSDSGIGRQVRFSHGLSPVQTLDQTGYVYINTAGEIVLPKEGEPYGSAEEFSPDGYAVASESFLGPVGYIDLDGDWVIEPQYMAASPFIDGIAEVSLDMQSRMLIDIAGNCVAEVHCPAMQLEDSIRKNLIKVRILGDDITGLGKCQFLRQDGSVMNDCIFDDATTFAEDYSYAQAKYEGLWGIIDSDGNWLIPPKFLALGISMRR